MDFWFLKDRDYPTRFQLSFPLARASNYRTKRAVNVTDSPTFSFVGVFLPSLLLSFSREVKEREGRKHQKENGEPWRVFFLLRKRRMTPRTQDLDSKTRLTSRWHVTAGLSTLESRVLFLRRLHLSVARRPWPLGRHAATLRLKTLKSPIEKHARQQKRQMKLWKKIAVLVFFFH